MDRFLSRPGISSDHGRPVAEASSSSVPSPSSSSCLPSMSSESEGRMETLRDAAATIGTKRRKDSSTVTGSKSRKSGDCKRRWHDQWEVNYLVSYDAKIDSCICLKCNNTLDTIKICTLQRHNEKMHPETNDWSRERRRLFVEQQKMRMKLMKSCLVEACVPSHLPTLATYLGLTLVQHHKPLVLNFGEAIVEWAQSCAPDSKVFKAMPKSRQTITRRVTELAAYIQDENRYLPLLGVSKWMRVQIKVALLRFVDTDEGIIETKFVTILRVERSATADNLYGVLNTYVESEGLPKQRLVSFTSDGASVMRSAKGGVAGHLQRNYNPSLHCIVYRQVLAAKDGLEKLPLSVHKTVDDVMKFFKNSHIRKERLEVIIQMTEEDHEYFQLVTYHKARWLSLNDCVQRFTDLLPEIVLYFEQEAHNTSL